MSTTTIERKATDKITTTAVKGRIVQRQDVERYEDDHRWELAIGGV